MALIHVFSRGHSGCLKCHPRNMTAWFYSITIEAITRYPAQCHFCKRSLGQMHPRALDQENRVLLTSAWIPAPESKHTVACGLWWEELQERVELDSIALPGREHHPSPHTQLDLREPYLCEVFFFFFNCKLFFWKRKWGRGVVMSIKTQFRIADGSAK